VVPRTQIERTLGGTIGVSSNVGNFAFQVIHISADLLTGTTDSTKGNNSPRHHFLTYPILVKNPPKREFSQKLVKK
jgi:hypothetical protein